MASPFEPPPIALTSLTIRDFRGIDDLKLEFLGPDGRPNRLAVISGPNGCGKTAVLEAALIAAGGAKLAVGRVGERAVRRGTDDYEIRASFQHPSAPDGRFDVTETAAPAPHQPLSIPHWYFSSWRAPKPVGAIDVTVGKSGRPAKTGLNRLRNVKSMLVNAAAAEHFAPSRPLLPGYTTWIAGINKAWGKYYPEHEGRFSVGLSNADVEGEGAFDVFYQREDEPRLPVDDLSAGQLELFLFLAALVLNDDREGIVFIDEPELHLDPQWHAPIVRSLMQLQPKAQFIVATHSLGIYAAAMSHQRHFLVPEDDPRAWAWPAVGAEV